MACFTKCRINDYRFCSHVLLLTIRFLNHSDSSSMTHSDIFFGYGKKTKFGISIFFFRILNATCIFLFITLNICINKFIKENNLIHHNFLKYWFLTKKISLHKMFRSISHLLWQESQFISCALYQNSQQCVFEEIYNRCDTKYKIRYKNTF